MCAEKFYCKIASAFLDFSLSSRLCLLKIEYFNIIILMMKKSIFLLYLILIFSFFLVSCGSKTDYKLKAESNPSLRNKITYMDKKTDWTESLDSDLEEEKTEEEITKNDIFSQIALAQKKFNEKEAEDKKKASVLPAGFSENSLVSRMFIPKNVQMSDSKYPSIKNFASLDTRQVDDKVFELVKKFVDCMNKKELDLTCVSESSKFLKPVFEYDFLLLDKIDSYIIGKPFIVKNENVDEYQLPVRLFTENAYYDTVFFLVQQNGKYFVEQIYYRGFYDE